MSHPDAAVKISAEAIEQRESMDEIAITLGLTRAQCYAMSYDEMAEFLRQRTEPERRKP